MKFPLAIMDYGIGGMGLMARIKEHYPHFPILYFSDSGEVPYGKLKAHVLKNRVNKVIDFLDPFRLRIKDSVSRTVRTFII